MIWMNEYEWQFHITIIIRIHKEKSLNHRLMQLITKCWRIAITYRRLLRLIEMSLYCTVKPTTVRSIALPPPTLPVVHSTKGWVEVELLMKHSQTIFWWWWYLQCVPEKLKTTLCQGWICFVRYFMSPLGQQNKPLTQYWHTEIMKKLRVTCDKKVAYPSSRTHVDIPY